MISFGFAKDKTGEAECYTITSGIWPFLEINIFLIGKNNIKFEHSYLFQDDNGRVRRLLMFKECLKYNIVPLFWQMLCRYYWYYSVKVVYYISDWRDNLCL